MNFLANSIQRTGHRHSKVTLTRMLVVLRLGNAAPHADRLSQTRGGSTTLIFVCQVLCWVFHTPLRTSECLLLRSHTYTCYTAHMCTCDVPLTCTHTFIPLTTSTGLGSQTVWVQTPCGHFLAGEAQTSYLTSLCPSFLICKMGLLMGSTSQGCHEEKNEATQTVLRTMTDTHWVLSKSQCGDAEQWVRTQIVLTGCRYES